jgi:predicted Zn-dependent protease
MLKQVLAGAAMAALCACATSPTGRSQFIMIPESEMVQMGAQAFQQMKTQQSVANDPGARRYVRCVAGAITAELSGEYANTNWEVEVFSDDTANAFALPGGKIGVHTGLLDVAENQHQLATVIGHEVGHVLARHGAERVSQRFAAGTALQLVGAYTGDQSSESSKAVMSLLGLGAQVGVLLPYSRLQESEADVIGLELMSRAGFDPRQSTELWRNMARQGGQRPPEFLSTHPDPQGRIRELNTHMANALSRYEQARGAGRRPNCG